MSGRIKEEPHSSQQTSHGAKKEPQYSQGIAGQIKQESWSNSQQMSNRAKQEPWSSQGTSSLNVATTFNRSNGSSNSSSQYEAEKLILIQKNIITLFENEWSALFRPLPLKIKVQ